MLTLNGRKLLLGGFHDHWSRADGDNPAVLLAALNFYHYDFVTLMCGPAKDQSLQAIAEGLSRKTKLYLGREEMFGWGHVVTVNPTAAPLAASDPDIRASLRKLKATCDLVILAHPPYIAWESLMETGELDKLLDEGLFDGVQFITDQALKPGTRDAQFWDWLRARESAGQRTAVVGGWDLHVMKALRGLPSVLYNPQFPPDGHYEAPCSSRTLLFAEDNTLSSICDAVRTANTVVERLPSGELFGPSELVNFLEQNGYREAVAALDAKRETVQLKLDRPLMACEPAGVTVSQSGTLRLPVSLHETMTVPVAADKMVTWPDVPVLLERDRAYLPIVWEGADGQERIWAVEREHSIQLDVLPLLEESQPAVEVTALRPFEGTVELTLEGASRPIRKEISETSRINLPVRPGPITRYQLRATNRAGISRTFEGHLTFFGMMRFRGDWSAVPKIGVDQTRYAPHSAYGAGRPWPGAEVYSAQLQFAWTSEAFLLRATVRDDVHYQPFKGHYTYNADCLQLAIDPMLRRKDTYGNVYGFNLALTQAGPEVYRTWGPGDEATDSFRPPKDDVSLADRFMKVERWSGGLVYDLTLPWTELPPVRPEVGHRMGVYFIMFNNNGTGHLDTLHWPVPISGMWMKPNQWGVLTLLG